MPVMVSDALVLFSKWACTQSSTGCLTCCQAIPRTFFTHHTTCLLTGQHCAADKPQLVPDVNASINSAPTGGHSASACYKFDCLQQRHTCSVCETHSAGHLGCLVYSNCMSQRAACDVDQYINHASALHANNKS